jgi:PKD repeat protein
MERTFNIILLAGLLILLLIPACLAGNTLTITGTVVKEQAPVADFMANTTTGPVPLAVQFTDLSTNDPTAWIWDFGDGKMSTERHPIHLYQNVGTYTVNLTASNSYGSDSEVKVGYIRVREATAEERIGALKEYVRDLEIPWWGEPLLVAPLNAALQSLATGDEKGAIDSFKTFTQNVRLLEWLNVVPHDKADYMIQESKEITKLIR